MDRLGLTSDEAEERVIRAVNRHHRRITASLGLVSTRRQDVSVTTVQDENEVTFTGTEKVLNVRIPASGSSKPLVEATVAQLREEEPFVAGWPCRYAILRETATTVTVLFDKLFADEYDIVADAYTTVDDLLGASEPQIPQSFHD